MINIKNITGDKKSKPHPALIGASSISPLVLVKATNKKNIIAGTIAIKLDNSDVLKYFGSFIILLRYNVALQRHEARDERSVRLEASCYVLPITTFYFNIHIYPLNFSIVLSISSFHRASVVSTNDFGPLDALHRTTSGFNSR